MSVNPVKRPRDDSDSEDERNTKKSRSWQLPQQHHEYPSSQTLPLRPWQTPTPPQTEDFFVNAMTPAQSDLGTPPDFGDDVMAGSDPLMDMDMDDFDYISSQPPESPLVPFLRPAKLNAELFHDPAVNNTGRIPTPIYGTFYPPRQSGIQSNSDLGGMGAPLIVGKHRQQNLQDPLDRRMPSPISEDEMDFPDTPTASTQSQLSRLSVSEGMETDDIMPPPDNPRAAFARKGRARSGAFTDKRKFSMGYREDCEKCRARIPGHYSHFLPS